MRNGFGYIIVLVSLLSIGDQAMGRQAPLGSKLNLSPQVREKTLLDQVVPPLNQKTSKAKLSDSFQRGPASQAPDLRPTVGPTVTALSIKDNKIEALGLGIHLK